MGGGIKRNRAMLPKGRSGLFGGSEPTPGDAQQGEWSRQRPARDPVGAQRQNHVALRIFARCLKSGVWPRARRRTRQHDGTR